MQRVTINCLIFEDHRKFPFLQLERELPLRAYFCGQKNDVEKARAPSPVSVKVGERSKDGGGHVIEGG